jgi:hypothetical protein
MIENLLNWYFDNQIRTMDVLFFFYLAWMFYYLFAVI